MLGQDRRAFWASLHHTKQTEFPSGPVVRIPSFTEDGPDSIPGQGTGIQQASRHSQTKKERICFEPIKFNFYFKIFVFMYLCGFFF